MNRNKLYDMLYEIIISMKYNLKSIISYKTRSSVQIIYIGEFKTSDAFDFVRIKLNNLFHLRTNNEDAWKVTCSQKELNEFIFYLKLSLIEGQNEYATIFRQ